MMTSGKLQRELKKRRPFASLEQEAMLNLVRAHDRLQIRFARLFRSFAITPSQYNVLRILRGEGKPLPILEIGQRTVAVVPAITGLIDRLEQAGFVARQRSEQDRRVVFAAITEKGEALLAQLDEPVMKLHEKLMAHLSPVDLAELVRLLEKIREPLSDPEES